MAEQGFVGGTDGIVPQKILQLHDLLTVRHSVFVMGGTGTGKSSLLQIAKSAFESAAAERSSSSTGGFFAEPPRRIYTETFDPKALSATELYGYVHPISREWRDGVLSRAFREFATNHKRYQHSAAQWIVLDGSIDAEWIESMNSVMDDNKLLTLVNNERINMSSNMRLLFEITNLDHATPATVSRAGILYMNRSDVGWVPMKERWLMFQPEKARAVLDPLFDKHFEKFVQFVSYNTDTIIPLNAVALLRSVCNLLQGMLEREEFSGIGATIAAPHNYERVFLWVCIWTFGLSLPSSAGSTDPRTIFSAFVKREFASAIKLPEGWSVFDVDIAMNEDTKEVEWRRTRDFWPALEISHTPTTAAIQAHRSLLNQSNPGTGYSGIPVIADQEPKSFIEDTSLMLTGSRTKLSAADVDAFNPYNRYSAYVPLRCRFVPASENTSSLIKVLATLVQNEKQILVVGEAGSGKSALLRYFTKRILPVLPATTMESFDSYVSAPGGAVPVEGSGVYDSATPPPLAGHNDISSPASPIAMSGSTTPRLGFARSGSGSSFTTSTFAADEVGMHANSDSQWLQSRLDRLIEKKAGRQFAPLNGKKLVVVLDNINLPTPDAFGSQSAHSLVRQFVEYGYWYDRQRLTPKYVSHLQLLPVLDPSKGPKEVSDRLLHKYFALGVQCPGAPAVQRILKSIVSQSLVERDVGITATLLSVIHTALDSLPDVLDLITRHFHPAVDSFHYHFTLREAIRVAQGFATVTGKATLESSLPSLWVHEVMHVFADQLITVAERDRCRTLTFSKGRSVFSASVGLESLLGDKSVPLFMPFANVEERADGTFEPLHPYRAVLTHDVLMQQVTSRMRGMALSTRFVLFDEALENICKVSRILTQPGSHGLVIGVGGSGKRSLIKLAAELSCFRLHQRDPTASHATSSQLGPSTGGAQTPTSASKSSPGIGNMSRVVGGAGPTGGITPAVEHEARIEFARLVHAAAVKNYRYCVILSQGDLENWGVRQIVDEYLTTGLCEVFASAEERNEIVSKMSMELRASGEPLYMQPAVCMEHLKFKLSNNLKIVCTLSPFLATLKPMLRSCAGFSETQIVYFLEWPREALRKVAERILFAETAASSGEAAGQVHTTSAPQTEQNASSSDLNVTPSRKALSSSWLTPLHQKKDAICTFLACTHVALVETTAAIRRQAHRDVYVTPKTFITFSHLVLEQLNKRRERLETRHTRLRVGLERLQQCRDRVAVLQVELGEYKKAVQQQAVVANMLLTKVNAERCIVEDQTNIAQAEHRKTQAIVAEVDALVAECEGDILAAQPIVDAARAALNTLNRPNLTELKTMNAPPEPVHAVTACVMCIIANPTRIPHDRSWAASRRMMADVPKWMKTLEDLDVNNIPDGCIDTIMSTVAHPWFNPQHIMKVSFAAASLCAWVVNVVKYHQIRVSLRPKEARLKEAQSRLASSQAQAKKVQDKCDALQAKLNSLVQQCNEAEAERDRYESLLDNTVKKLERAQRLLSSLADERERWSAGLETSDGEREYLDGDSLIGAAFTTYCGSLPAEVRDRLLSSWKRELRHLELPCSPEIDLVRTLFSDSENMVWRNEGLAAASYMAQNAAVTLASIRWPMLIDPQHAALRWLRGRSVHRRQELTVLNTGHSDFVLNLVNCINHGHLTVVELSQLNDIPPVLLALVEKRYTYKTVKHVVSVANSDADENEPLMPETVSSEEDADTDTSDLDSSTTVLPADQSPLQLQPSALLGAPGVRRKSGATSPNNPSLGATTTTMVHLTSSVSAQHLSNAVGPGFTIQTCVDIGSDHEAVVHPDFFLVFRCVVANPALQPDIFAQCAVVNFCVTESALSEELLSVVVKLEKPDLEQARAELNEKMNFMMVSLRDCENLLLEELASASGDVLENERLVVTLEQAKQQSVELTASLAAATVAKETLNEALGVYQPIATRGTLMYLAVTELFQVDALYHYSIDLFLARFAKSVEAFSTALLARQKAAEAARTLGGPAQGLHGVPQSPSRRNRPSPGAIDATAPELTQEERVEQLKGVVTRDLFAFVDQSLFSEHKLVFAMTVAMTVMQRSGEIDPAHVVHFVRGSRKSFGEPPKHVADWMSKQQWEELNRLVELDGTPPFKLLVDECLETTRWRQWCELSRPESERYPGEWKSASPFQKLLIVRALRPDRLVAATHVFLQDTFLAKSWQRTDSNSVDPLLRVLQELPRCSPVMFLLTPGMDPEVHVSAAAAAVGMGEKLEVLSMGQNQERRAEVAMSYAEKNGGWVLLHNTHLMRAWLPVLDARVQQLVVDGDSTHSNFRLFLSCEPVDHVPSGLLQNSVKLVNEPPSGLRAHFLRAYQQFAHEPWEHCTKPHEYHVTVFSLCFFHAVVVERSKFGPVGWNKRYPFNTEDLLVCADVLATYLEDRPRVPWDDLRYMFGEIMYGGHITDQWDRRLCMTYLSYFVSSEILERAEIAPGIPLPTSRNFEETKAYMEDIFPAESPELYQLNPLSESRVRLREGRQLVTHLVNTISSVRGHHHGTIGPTIVTGATPTSPMSPVHHGSPSHVAAAASAAAEDDRIDTIAMLCGSLPELVSLDDVTDRLVGESMTPFHHVFYRECERMNRLVGVMQRSLDAAEAAVRGTQAMSAELDALLIDVACDRIPQHWAAHWGPTKRPLGAWLVLIGEAAKQLHRWALELLTPKLIHIGCFFVPIALFGAVLQDASLKIGEALDHMGVVVEVTKRQPHQVDLHAREGCFIYGLSLEGASWDSLTQSLQDAQGRDGMSLPVLILRAASNAKIDRSDQYACPLYKTTDRAASYVTSLFLRTKAPAAQWVLRGTALVLDALY